MSCKGRKTYCQSWEKEFQYPRKAPNDKYCGFCVACNKIFLIDGSGIAQVRSHMSRPTHLEHEKQWKNQVTFSRSADDYGAVVMNRRNIALSPNEQVMKAEILQPLKTVDSNLSFAAANGDGDGFQIPKMFPDSKIVQRYKQNERKIMYVIKYGLCPYFRESLKSDLHSKAFCFWFDETTTSQIKKQGDGFVRY